MPNLFGEPAYSMQDIVRAFRKHGDGVRCTYRAHYTFDRNSTDPYAPPKLERPQLLADNPPAPFPWEQVFVAAAACAGSDYPMLAALWKIPLDRIDLVVEGVFDPRGEFDGLEEFTAPADARHCFLGLHLKATLLSDAAQAELERIHGRVLSHNMVLGALRGVPLTGELVLERPVTLSALQGGAR